MPPKPPKSLFEDEHLLAVSKPRGLLTVGNKPGQKNLLDQFKSHYSKQNIRLRPLNRLDRGTSGIVLFAKTRECFEKAIDEKLFADPETQKTYFALIKGIPKRKSGSVTFPLPSRQDKRRLLKAKTKYSVLSSVTFTDGSLSLVEAHISSGRYHQIRVHLAKIYHPLMMDRDYMERKDYKYWQRLIPLRHFFLHAAKITFRHFITGEQITITDPPTKEFKRTLKLFGLKFPELK